MSLDQVKAALSRGGEHLGDIVWWTLSEAHIPRPALELVWVGAGLAADHLPEPPTAEKALRCAVRESAARQSDHLVRLGKEDRSEIVFAIVHETRLGDGSVTYQQEARVLLDRSTEILSCDSPGHELGRAIVDRFAQLRSTHTPDDIRRGMLRVLDGCAAITLREHGGVYWVPAPHAETVRRLQDAVEKIGTSRVYLLPVHASADANRTLADAAQLALEDELAALKAEVEQFIASPPDRTSTLVRRLDAFEQLKSRAALYRDVLQVQVQDLDRTLTYLASSIEALLNARAAA